ncbi:MAG TPA: tetratricopeptide repeat protein [Terriglobia bacterium]|nr:tetratricopeptide repeat protein [Terriglobia bacterium]
MAMTEQAFYNASVFNRIAAVFAVCAVSYIVAFAAPLSASADSNSVLVFCFENQTDDRNIDWIGTGISEMVLERLAAERSLYVFNRDERTTAYERMGIPETITVSRATAVSIAWDTGADSVVVGKISGTHQDFRIEAHILNLRDASSGPAIVVKGELQNVVPMATSLSFQLARQLVPGTTIPESDYTLHPPVPSSAFEAYTRGMMASDSSRRIALFQDAIRLDPKYSSAIYQLGRQYFLDMDFKASIPLLEKINEASPDYPQSRFMLGLNYYNAGDFSKSAELFSALPPVYDVLINLGMAIAGRGDFREAMATWKRAADLNPLGTEALFNLAHLGLTRGERVDAEAAAKSIEQYLKLSGRDAEAIFLQGRIYERLGRAEEAQRLITSAVNLSPRLTRWVNQALPNFRRLRTPVNVTELRLAPQTTIWNDARLARRAIGRDLVFWLDSVQDLIDSQRFAEAIVQLQDIDRTFPRSAETRLVFAEVYESQKQTELAVKEYQRALALKPSADTWVLLARLYRSTNQPASERQAIEEALKLEPGNSGAVSLKAELDRPAGTGRRRQ